MRKVMGLDTGSWSGRWERCWEGAQTAPSCPPGPAAPTSAMCPAPTSEMQLKLRTNESRL